MDLTLLDLPKDLLCLVLHWILIVRRDYYSFRAITLSCKHLANIGKTFDHHLLSNTLRVHLKTYSYDVMYSCIYPSFMKDKKLLYLIGFFAQFLNAPPSNFMAQNGYIYALRQDLSIDTHRTLRINGNKYEKIASYADIKRKKKKIKTDERTLRLKQIKCGLWVYR